MQDTMQDRAQDTLQETQDRAHDTMQKPMEQTKNALEQVENIPSNIYYGGVIGSIVLSALLMMMGKRNLSLFVGLWPPTILNLALFSKQLRPSREISSMETHSI